MLEFYISLYKQWCACSNRSQAVLFYHDYYGCSLEEDAVHAVHATPPSSPKGFGSLLKTGPLITSLPASLLIWGDMAWSTDGEGERHVES